MKKLFLFLIIFSAATSTFVFAKTSISGNKTEVIVNTGGNVQDNPDATLETGDAKAEVEVFNIVGSESATPAITQKIYIEVNGQKIIPSPKIVITKKAIVEKPKEAKSNKFTKFKKRILELLSKLWTFSSGR